MVKDNDTIVVKENNGIRYIQFRKLNDIGIRNAYSLKNDALNFYYKNDLLENSFKLIADAAGVDPNNVVRAYQDHTSNVRCIDKKYETDELLKTDGLITDRDDISLLTTNADCVLISLYDKKNKVIANVHSGWKGTFQKIIEKALVKMITSYKTNPKDVLVFISPCIRKCHFEVGEDVKELCENIFYYFKNIDSFIEKGDIKNGDQKYFIDIVGINKRMLKENGIEEANIYDSNICSVCESKEISSYRVEGKKFRLAASIISL